ncbi:MAG TPA: 2Fe-2S iron-sulfur cluster-binding protein [Thermomicrobiales bacterium]|jgi:ferredoxin|nr:2Fe-2S iron-sulfur cluster-binding protein [Thermomicrobiales bacterium]
MPENGRITVHVQDEGDVTVERGRRLVLGLEDAGIDILHRCGGNARCATCRVEVIEGEPTPVTPWEETRLAELKNRRETTRLACQIRVLEPLTVRVVNRLSQKPELGDAGPRPVEWPVDQALEPEP